MDSKKLYGVWATRSAASVAGFKETWCKKKEVDLTWVVKAQAQAYCDHLMTHKMSAKISYEVRDYE